MRQLGRHLISVVLVTLVAAGMAGSTFLFDMKPRLGLDLRGGLSVTLTAPPGTPPDQMDKAVDILRARVDRAGVAEPEISRESTNNILIQLPGTGDPQRLLGLIGRTAQLQFRAVKRVIPPSDPAYAGLKPSGGEDPGKPAVLVGKKRVKYELDRAELTGDAVRRGTARTDESGNWQVLLDFKRAGSKSWLAFTARLACNQGVGRQIAIVLDGRVEIAPPLASGVNCNEGITGGQTQITGQFTQSEAKDLALVLTAGALPVKLTQSEVRAVSPTLGRDSLRAGLLAGAIGLALVMLYVLIYYRALGLQTWFGLIVFSSVIYGLTGLFGALIGWNLTLSGIAGLIVSIGIAADSYIVFFERVKEEIHQGRTLRASIDRGFKHAWRTMRTANTVTILAAVVLYFLAVGPVRGFALALGVATGLDLAVTYLLTWPLAALLARNRFFADNRVMGMRRALEGAREGRAFLRKIYRSEFKVDFIGRRRLWFAMSALMVIISAVALIPGVRGLNYGIDFKGGSIYRASVDRSLTVPKVKQAMTAAGLQDPVVQIVRDRTAGRTQIQVQTRRSVSPSERTRVTEAFARAAGIKPADVGIDTVGEKWGSSVTIRALRGLGLFLILTILYVSWRLEPKMAAAGIVALLHDLIITAGLYALVGFEVTPATVIATLTILGFSLYDTVVVFDKVKENESAGSRGRMTFAQIANDSSNQVLMRSVSTSLTVLLPVGSLLFVGSALLGAGTLKDLALALFVGVAVGTYSSIYLATPLLSVWKEREPRYALNRARRDRPKVRLPMDQPERREDAAGWEDSSGSNAPVPAGLGLPDPTRTGSSGAGTTRTAAAPRGHPRKNQSRAQRKKKRR